MLKAGVRDTSYLDILGRTTLHCSVQSFISVIPLVTLDCLTDICHSREQSTS